MQVQERMQTERTHNLPFLFFLHGRKREVGGKRQVFAVYRLPDNDFLFELQNIDRPYCYTVPNDRVPKQADGTVDDHYKWF